MASTTYQTQPLSAPAPTPAPPTAPQPGPIIPPPSLGEVMQTMLGKAISMGCAEGGKYGALYGVIVGFFLASQTMWRSIAYTSNYLMPLGTLVIILIAGAIIGCILGVMGGLVIGGANGVGVALLSRLCFRRPSSWPNYRAAAGAMSLVLTLAVPAWLITLFYHPWRWSDYLLIALPFLLPALIACAVFWRISGSLAVWYAEQAGLRDSAMLLYTEHSDLYDQSFQDALFEASQPSYGRVMRALSAGQHQRWRAQLLQLMDLAPGMRVCDLMSGSGEMWEPILDLIGPDGRLIAVERTPAMLRAAEQRIQAMPGAPIELVKGDVLATGLPSRSVDAVICTFGAGMITPAQTLSFVDEIHRMLNDHGIFGLVEFSMPRNRLVRVARRAYLRFVAPPLTLAQLSRPRYTRLMGSYITRFHDGQALAHVFSARGFEVHRYQLLGGCATVLVGMKA
ncbi:MAG TPA: class I SAM-dependent methyltransferase [Roseiflexaceae bacterium]|nr:class I SAM-dependent methyltransferase [Roseiflexaceae bacterium]